jgi:hypothetical protein
MEQICEHLGPVIQSRFEEDRHSNAGEDIASSLITNRHGECQYLGELVAEIFSRFADHFRYLEHAVTVFPKSSDLD